MENRGFIRTVLVPAIIVAIISTAFIDPALNWIWISVSYVADIVYAKWLNSIYLSAALGHRNHYSFLVLWIIFIGPFIGAIVLLLGRRNVKHIANYIIERSPRNRTIVNLIGKIFVAIWSLSALATMSSLFAELQYSTSFEQRLTALSPSISEQEEESLRAQWANMRSRLDYEGVNARLEELAKRNGISLPEPLLN